MPRISTREGRSWRFLCKLVWWRRGFLVSKVGGGILTAGAVVLSPGVAPDLLLELTGELANQQVGTGRRTTVKKSLGDKEEKGGSRRRFERRDGSKLLWSVHRA